VDRITDMNSEEGPSSDVTATEIFKTNFIIFSQKQRIDT